VRSRVKDEAGQEGGTRDRASAPPAGPGGGSGKVTVLFMGALVLTEKDDP